MKEIHQYVLLLIALFAASAFDLYVERSKSARQDLTVDSLTASVSIMTSAAETKLESLKMLQRYIATDSAQYRKTGDSLNAVSAALQEQSIRFVPYKYRK